MIANQVRDVAETGPWLNAVARFRTTKIFGNILGGHTNFSGRHLVWLGSCPLFFLGVGFLGCLGLWGLSGTGSNLFFGGFEF